MFVFAKNLKTSLSNLICEMNQNRKEFVKDPDKDFTRTRKLDFEKLLESILVMGSNTLQKELYELFDYSSTCISKAGFLQQREKLKSNTLEVLFHRFNQILSKQKKPVDYHLLACDGCRIPIFTNPADTTTFHRLNRKCQKGCNHLFLHALFDLQNKQYVDATVVPFNLSGEARELEKMIARLENPSKTIVIADRGYECYNTFAHAVKVGAKFVVRIKDVTTTSGILANKNLPAAHGFDIDLPINLTKSQAIHRSNPQKYKFLYSTSRFDFFSKEKPVYPLNLRIVRFLVGDNFECIATNLDRNEFSSEQIKVLYRQRWDIETSFRELKHAIGLLNLHSRKAEHITQEIFARLTLYNFCEAIAAQIILKQKHKQYVYQLNHTMAVHFCRRFLKDALFYNKENNIEALFQRNILPIRLNRSFPRNVRRRGYVSFLYRLS